MGGTDSNWEPVKHKPEDEIKDMISSLNVKADQFWRHIKSGTLYRVQSISLITNTDFWFSVNYYSQDSFVATGDPILFSREYKEFILKFELQENEKD